MEEYVSLIRDFGPTTGLFLFIVHTVWDKLKTGDALRMVVENNTIAINDIKQTIIRIEKFLYKHGYQ